MTKSERTDKEKEELRTWLSILTERYAVKKGYFDRSEPKCIGWLSSPNNTDGSLDSI
jgi:hypothetical protein